MRRAIPGAMALVLTACQVVGNPVVRPATRSPAPAQTQASFAPTASTRPSTAASGAAVTPKPADPQAALLKPPAGGYHTLTGVVVADPQQVVSTGGGKLLSNNGGSFSAPSGVSLIANNGGGLIANNGGGLIANNGGGLLVDAGGSLVAAASGNLIPSAASGLTARQGGAAVRTTDGSLAAAGGIISDNGSALIANNGGGVITNNAGNLIANNGGGLTGKVKYGLQQAAERPPTAGMLVSAVSLKTHEYLPVGVDEGGQPVYAIYSNMKGEYQLFIPEAEAGNVLVVTSAPNTRDPHLVLDAFTPTAAKEAVRVDDASSHAARLMRQLFVAHLTNVLTNGQNDGYLASLNGNGKSLDAGASALLKAMSEVVGARAKQAGVPAGPGADAIPEVRELAQLIADVGAGFAEPDQLVTSQLFVPEWKQPGEPVSKGLAEAFEAIRLATERYMAAHPGAPVQLPLQIDGRTDPAATAAACPVQLTVPLTAPADMGAFIVDRLLGGREAHSIINTRTAIEALAVPAIVPGSGLTYSENNPNWYTVAANGSHELQSKRISACINTVIATMAITMTPPGWKAGDPVPPALQRTLDVIDRFVVTHKFSAPPAATPTPTCLADPVATP